MACEVWRERLDSYLEGELAAREAVALAAHLRTCAECGAEALACMQMKRTVSAAGSRYRPSTQFRARVIGTIATKPVRPTRWWRSVPVPAAAVIVLVMALGLYLQTHRSRQMQVFSELTDLHVAALASASPIDVVSSDRHTVKPWFEGKIPFTFNLPELQGSEFTLLGGRVTYLEQSPGAQLIYQFRKHQISVFIFPDRGEEVGSPSGSGHALSFNTESWRQDGLRYFVVGDVGSGEIEALSKLLRSAG